MGHQLMIAVNHFKSLIELQVISLMQLFFSFKSEVRLQYVNNLYVIFLILSLIKQSDCGGIKDVTKENLPYLETMSLNDMNLP